MPDVELHISRNPSICEVENDYGCGCVKWRNIYKLMTLKREHLLHLIAILGITITSQFLAL